MSATFIGIVAGGVTRSIQRGEKKAMSSRDSDAAYRLSADLIVAGVTSERRTGSDHDPYTRH